MIKQKDMVQRQLWTWEGVCKWSAAKHSTFLACHPTRAALLVDFINKTDWLETDDLEIILWIAGSEDSKPGTAVPQETGYLHLRPVLTLDSSFLSFITTFSLPALGSNKYLSNMHVYWVALKSKKKMRRMIYKPNKTWFKK